MKSSLISFKPFLSINKTKQNKTKLARWSLGSIFSRGNIQFKIVPKKLYCCPAHILYDFLFGVDTSKEEHQGYSKNNTLKTTLWRMELMKVFNNSKMLPVFPRIYNLALFRFAQVIFKFHSELTFWGGDTLAMIFDQK